MQCQENGRRTMSRSAQILRGLFGFKVKSLYKKSLGSSVDYQGYCFGVFGRYSNNTVPGPQQSQLDSTTQATVMTLPPYKIRGILRLKIQPRRGLCRNLTLRRRGNRPKAVIWEGIHCLQMVTGIYYHMLLLHIHLQVPHLLQDLGLSFFLTLGRSHSQTLSFMRDLSAKMIILFRCNLNVFNTYKCEVLFW